MKFQVATGQIAAQKGPLLYWVREDGSSGSTPFGLQLKKTVTRLRKDRLFKGKRGETFLLPLDSQPILLVGLGKKEGLTPDLLRHTVATAVRRAVASGLEKIALSLPALTGTNPHLTAQAVTEGIILGLYKYEEFKKSSGDSPDSLKQVTLVVERASQKGQVQSGLREGQLVAEAVCWARDLGNTPANHMTPRRMAEEAKSAGRKFGFKVSVLDPAQMKKLGMNAVLAVAQGSKQPARFIVMEYAKGTQAKKKPLVLVGKGITFDSGGISIKPSNKMDEMKFDMCGGAAVLGAMRAIAALKLPIRVVGLVPATENLPGGCAQRPGDIIRSLGGKTIEVLNTDAEGRLILADALGYADRFKPSAIVDLATLTGAVVVALGSEAIGLMGNDPKWIEEVKVAGERSGERTWELPLWSEFTDAIRSEIADVKNIGNGKAGTITAGAFLKEFVKEKTPWVHLDIAGVAWADGSKGYNLKGGTGSGVRLLVELARHWRSS